MPITIVITLALVWLHMRLCMIGHADHLAVGMKQGRGSFMVHNWYKIVLIR